MLFEPPPRGPGEPPRGPEEPQPRRPDEIFCPNCGSLNKRMYAYCTNCGANLVVALEGMGPAGLAAVGTYPVRFDVAYPQKLSRLTTFFRLILAIPQLLIVYALSTVVGVITFVAWFAILFTRRYPKGMFDLVVGLTRWSSNVYAYVALFQDKYPPFATDPGRYPVLYEVDYPERLSRWLIFVKWFLNLGHQFVLNLLSIIGALFYFLSWFAILFTGRYPKSFFDFNVGLMRWYLRVQAYTSLLRDEFPPFSKRADAGPGSGRAVALSAVLGLGMVGLYGAVFLLSFASSGIHTQTVTVSYAQLERAGGTAPVLVDGTRVILSSADDPFQDPRAGSPDSGSRFLAFRLSIAREDSAFTSISSNTYGMTDTAGHSHAPKIALLSRALQSDNLDRGEQVEVSVVFELPVDANPATLTYSPGWAAFLPVGERVRYVFL